MTIASILLALVVGTWNGEWFPSGRAEHRASDEVERETIRAAGQMLRELFYVYSTCLTTSIMFRYCEKILIRQPQTLTTYFFPTVRLP